MRNFFEQELRKLFEDEEMIQSPQFSGRACLGTLDYDVRVRAEFVTTKVADYYDALKITVLNRKDGVIDRILLRIEDMIGRKKIPSNPYFKMVCPRISGRIRVKVGGMCTVPMYPTTSPCVRRSRSIWRLSGNGPQSAAARGRSWYTSAPHCGGMWKKT